MAYPNVPVQGPNYRSPGAAVGGDLSYGGRLYGNTINDLITFKMMYNTFFRDVYIVRATKDKMTGWGGNPIPVPFEAGRASNYQAGGQLVPLSRLERDSYVRGTIPGYKRINSAFVVDHQDLVEHDGRQNVPRDTFLRIKVGEKMMDQRENFAFQLGYSMLNGRVYDTVSAVSFAGSVKQHEGAATNYTTITAKITAPDRFTIGQNVFMQNSLTYKSGAWAKPTQSSDARYGTYVRVRAIDINAKTLLLTKVTKTSGSGNNPDTYTEGNFVTGEVGDNDNAKFSAGGKPEIFLPGNEVPADCVTSLRQQVLPGSAGGSDTLFGVTKRNYVYLQSLNVDKGTDWTNTSRAGDIVFDILDILTDFNKYAQPRKMKGKIRDRGNKPTQGRMGKTTLDLVMSLDWYNVFRKLFARTRGEWFKATSSNTIEFMDAHSFYWTDPRLDLAIKSVGVHGMPDDIMYIKGEDTTKLASNRFIAVHQSPVDGNKFYVIRSEKEGYSYVCDFWFYGDLILKRPAGMAAIYNLPSPRSLTKFDYGPIS